MEMLLQKILRVRSSAVEAAKTEQDRWREMLLLNSEIERNLAKGLQLSRSIRFVSIGEKIY
jgi:hypothetical protein